MHRVHPEEREDEVMGYCSEIGYTYITFSNVGYASCFIIRLCYVSYYVGYTVIKLCYVPYTILLSNNNIPTVE